MGRRGSFDAEDFEDLPEVRMLDESFVDGEVDSRRAILLKELLTPLPYRLIFPHILYGCDPFVRWDCY